MGATDTKKPLTVRQPKGMQSEAVHKLIALKMEKDRQLRPSLPAYAQTFPSYDDRTANGLTKCIIEFLNMTDGCHAERIGNEGRTIDTRKTYTDVIGQVRQTGSIKRIKSSGQNGTADVSATILGRSVKIEIKVGNDRQSEDQKEYQRQIENAKGYYLLVKDFQSFYDWFNSKYQKANE